MNPVKSNQEILSKLGEGEGEGFWLAVGSDFRSVGCASDPGREPCALTASRCWRQPWTVSVLNLPAQHNYASHASTITRISQSINLLLRSQPRITCATELCITCINDHSDQSINQSSSAFPAMHYLRNTIMYQRSIGSVNQSVNLLLRSRPC